MFYEWETTTFIQKIEIAAKDLYWNPSSNQLAVTTASEFFVLEYNKLVPSTHTESQRLPRLQQKRSRR